MIIIKDYSPEWPHQFETIKADLAAVLGSLAVRIDHIGSTSVPGLGAKDIIDVQITVTEFVGEIVEKMVAAGYENRPHLCDHIPAGEDAAPSLWEKRMLVQRPGDRPTNIHVRKLGNPNQRFALIFRDYLREHPDSAATIEHIKRQLARYHQDDWDAYYDIKDPIYDLIWDAAKDWSKQTQWIP